MIKIISVLLLSTLLLSAGDRNSALKIEILKKIVSGIEKREKMKIWSDDPAIMTAFHSLKQFNITGECNDADMVILDKKENLAKRCLKSNIFVLNYKLLHDVPESFGAFFWKKGRPNIVFIESRVKKKGIELSAELNPYMEEKVW